MDWRWGDAKIERVRRILVLLAALLGLGINAAPAIAAPPYAVVFEVDLADGGTVRSLKVSGIVLRKGDKPPKIPDSFIAAARVGLEAQYRGKPAGHFYTYLLFDPAQPTNVQIGGPAASEESGQKVTIHRGETVTVRMVGDRQFLTGGRDPVAAGVSSQLEESFLSMQAAGAKTVLPKRLDLPKEPPVLANVVQLTMKAGATAGQTLLIVENGYDRPLRYRARIVRASGTEPTSVCEVAPHKIVFEYWSEKLETLDLSEFELVQAQSDGGLHCR
jgi:hypothetical protein